MKKAICLISISMLIFTGCGKDNNENGNANNNTDIITTETTTIEETNNNNLVFLDIFNAGDFVARMVEIHLIINHNPPICLDRINFISPKENFEFYLGRRIDKKIILFNGDKYELANPIDYDYFTETTNENIITLTIRTI